MSENFEPKTDEGKKLKAQKLLYHLTNYKNLKSIFKNGLLPRSMMDKISFEDTANHEILNKRKKAKLDERVPFHFFENGPYDGSVRKAHDNDDFAYICVARENVKSKCDIIVGHPLNQVGDGDIEINGWNDGMRDIDWDLMGKKDFKDNPCKQMCMSEALYNGSITIDMIQSVKVPSKYKNDVEKIKKELKADFFVDSADYLEAINKKNE